MAEDTVTLKWWGILSLVALVLGFFFLAILSHETRITRNEEACKSIIEIKTVVKEIRMDQIRKYEAEIREAKEAGRGSGSERN